MPLFYIRFLSYLSERNSTAHKKSPILKQKSVLPGSGESDCSSLISFMAASPPSRLTYCPHCETGQPLSQPVHHLPYTNTLSHTYCDGGSATFPYSQTLPTSTHAPPSSANAQFSIPHRSDSISVTSSSGSVERHPLSWLSTLETSLHSGSGDQTTPAFSKVSCVVQEKFDHQGHASYLLQRMSDQLGAGKVGSRLTDVVLIAGEKRLAAHRIVLSAASDYFAAMFSCDLTETKQPEITLKEVDPDSLELIINYVYTGNLSLNEEIIENLMSTACLLQMTEVVEACEHFLMRLLHPSNCIGIRQFAEMRGCPTLFDKATTYVLDNFASVVQQNEFLTLLSAEDFLSLLHSENLNVPEELVVFQAIILWTRHDTTNRKRHLPNLLTAVKLPLLSASVLSEIVASDSLITECLDSLRIVMDAMRCHLVPSRTPSLVPLSACHPRRSTIGRLWAIGGMTTAKGLQEIQEFNPRVQQWSRVGKLPMQRLQFGCALMDSSLVIVGGRDGLKTLNLVESYNLILGSWQIQASMGTHRHGLGVAVLQGVLYAVGGHDGWSYLNSVERWDPTQKNWSFVSPMSMPRSTVGVVSLQGKLYAVGGRDGGACLRMVECFDPHLQKWAPCSPMRYRRGGLGLAALGSHLYAIGGHDAPTNQAKATRFASVERYSPVSDQWTLISQGLSNPRESIGVAPLGDSLYIVGGFDGKTYNDEVEAYNPTDDKWTKVSPLSTGRAGVVVVPVPACFCDYKTT